MDQIKIGKFIAECRKNKNITQAQLAEKLNITDRAVSKWENGKSLPDSSLMLELCDILEITVNDLLCGEKVSSEEYTGKLQERLLEAIDSKMKADVILWRICMLFTAFISMAFVTITLYDYYVFTRVSWVVWNIWLLLTIPALYLCAKYSRQAAGYCRCEKCGTVYLPSANAWFWSNAFSLKKMRMRCPHCKKRTLHRKDTPKS